MPRTKEALLELDPQLHLQGCPVITGSWPNGEERDEPVEQYPSTRPSGEEVVVRRCVVCGGHAITSLGREPVRAPEPIEEEA